MKLTAENSRNLSGFSKKATALKEPFFNKGTEGSFFSKNNTAFNQPFFSKGNHPIQTQLKIGQPGDKYEQEADAVADKVVNNTSSPSTVLKKMGNEEEIRQKPLATSITPLIQKQTSAMEEEEIQTKCATCEKEEAVQKMEAGEVPEEEKEKEAIQQKSFKKEEEKLPVQKMNTEAPGREEEEESIQSKSDGKSPAPTNVEAQLNGRKGSGSALEKGIKNEMEQGFGADFSGVKIHTGSNAIQMNEQLNAKAFTHGKDIYFNQGQFNPSSKAGKHLLAHELTHVQQQNTGMIQKDELDSGTAIGKSLLIPSIGIDSSAANTNTVQVSPGENMIFNLRATDRDRRRTSATSPWVVSDGTGPYEINFSITGDAELDASGSGTTAKRIVGLNTGNVFVFVKSTWNRTSAITITATVTDNATAAAPDTGSLKDPNKTFTWNLVKRANSCPTSLKRVAGPGAVWSAAPADYTYQAMPDIAPRGRPDYQGQAILERFGTITALGFTMSDLTDVWKAANPAQNTPDKVARFLWNSGSNGTFVLDSSDMMADRHGGFGVTSPFKASAFNDADGVGYRLPQEYVCGSTVIGTATIDRRSTTAHGTQIKKTGP